MQRVREFFESKVKILLIVSIPQDVFIASGATVKPSLMFFKKFTEEERKQYDAIKEKATNEITSRYQKEIDELNELIAKRGKDAPKKEEKKKAKDRLKEIDNEIQEYVKQEIKQQFNYIIPVAEVEKAGISTTGQPIENELLPLAKEFNEYRTENSQWNNIIEEMEYKISNNGDVTRIRVTGKN